MHLWLLCSKAVYGKRICCFLFPCEETTFVTFPLFQSFVKRMLLWLLSSKTLSGGCICDFSFVPWVHLWLPLCSMSAFVTSPLFQSQARRPEGGVSIHSHRHTDRKAWDRVELRMTLTQLKTASLCGKHSSCVCAWFCWWLGDGQEEGVGDGHGLKWLLCWLLYRCQCRQVKMMNCKFMDHHSVQFWGMSSLFSANFTYSKDPPDFLKKKGELR